MSRHTLRATAFFAAALLALQPLAAAACAIPQGVDLSATDEDRMAEFWQSRSQGLAEALVAPSYNDRATLHGLFAQGDRYIDAIPDGNYRCRTVKLGGILPLTVYGYFACTISEGGTRIDKTTGSQRFSGTLTSAKTAVFYQGALHYGDEEPIAYGMDSERDQVGCIYRVRDDETTRYRLELPSPHFESTHDVIELVPQG